MINFNPLPRKRENCVLGYSFTKKFIISIHSLARGRTKCCAIWMIMNQFQSTPSQEGERHRLESASMYHLISIHSLARGRTDSRGGINLGEFISIHSLARGRTLVFIGGTINRQFQSTPSQEGELQTASL